MPTNNEGSHTHTSQDSSELGILCLVMKDLLPRGVRQNIMDKVHAAAPRNVKGLGRIDELLETVNRSTAIQVRPVPVSAAVPAPAVPPQPPTIFSVAGGGTSQLVITGELEKQARGLLHQFTEVASNYPPTSYPLFFPTPIMTYNGARMIVVVCGLVRGVDGNKYDHGFEVKSFGLTGKGEMVRKFNNRLLQDESGESCLYTRGAQEGLPQGVTGYLRIMRYEEGLLFRFWFKLQGGKSNPANDRFFQVINGAFVPVTKDEYFSGRGKF